MTHDLAAGTGPRRIIIMGAAGRDFHNFNVVYRGDPTVKVIAFTATQIPGIAERIYPPELAGSLYPDGIPIVRERDLEEIIDRFDADEVIFSYSDVSHETVMHLASRALAAGADFSFLGPKTTMVDGEKPTIAICATRTGCGKSQTTRALARILSADGYKVAAIRHPMPYGDLVRQRVQRFAEAADLDLAECTIEEREEYEPYLAQGLTVFAGVDYEEIRREAEKEADLILWDGGNNDMPFYVPDLIITVTDPLRPGSETSYHPGEANLRMADVVVINKIDSASREQIDPVIATIRDANPEARIIEARSTVTLEGDVSITGQKVIVIDDGPTLTHGGMSFGAGVVAAERAGAVLVDPRPWAQGSVQDAFDHHPHIGRVIPAMGYSEEQRKDLEDTINASDADVVVIGTPIDLRRVCNITKPTVRVRYELEQRAAEELATIVVETLGLEPIPPVPASSAAGNRLAVPQEPVLKDPPVVTG